MSYTDGSLGWHFLRSDGRLRYDDDRLPKIGERLRMIGKSGNQFPVICVCGMHASETALQALPYAPGPIACRVALSGEIVHGRDKMAGEYRTVLARADASDTLRDFTLWCAEQVIDLCENADTIKLCRDAIRTARAMAFGDAYPQELWAMRERLDDCSQQISFDYHRAFQADDDATSSTTWRKLEHARDVIALVISAIEYTSESAMIPMRAASVSDEAALVYGKHAATLAGAVYNGNSVEREGATYHMAKRQTDKLEDALNALVYAGVQS